MVAARHLFIVTGASRGLGHGIVQAIAASTELGTTSFVLGMARGDPESTVHTVAHEHWRVDLTASVAVAERLTGWLRAFDASALLDATLINNAAALSDPGPLEDSSLARLADSVRVGLEAPAVLTAAFLDATRAWRGVRRRVLHVSSGLGRRAMAGSAAYCAVKAGLDHMARAQALEQLMHKERGEPHAAVVSFAPGVIETGMQATLRGADAKRFPERKRFAALAEQGLLDTPEVAARKLLAFLERPDYGHEPVADVRNAN
jgi:benzil reductase ((S)-benzoin forming)